MDGLELIALGKAAIALVARLIPWGVGKVKSARWEHRLREINKQLLLPRPDIAAAQELVELAEQARYKGRELAAVKRRLEQVLEYEAATKGAKVRARKKRKAARAAKERKGKRHKKRGANK